MKPSLFVSLIRRTNEDDPKFREIQSRWFYRLKQRVLIYGSIIAVGFAVYWLQTRPRTVEVDPTEQIKKLDAARVLEQKTNLSTRELLFMASEMESDPDAPLPVIMDFFKARMEISDQLLSKTEDELAQKEGTLYRIEALQNLSKLNRTHSMGYSTIDEQLYELCSANLGHRDPEVSKMAAVAIMITSWDEFTYEPTTANLNNALSKCNQVASQLNDDDEIAKAIFTYAKMKKRSDVTVDDSTEFFNVIIKHFSNSNNSDAREIAGKAYREILFGNSSNLEKFSLLLVAGIKDRFRQQRRSVEKELNNRIRFAMQSRYFDSDALQQLMRLLEIFPTVGKIESATQIANEAASFFATLSEGQLKEDATQSISDYRQRIGKFGEQIDLNRFSPLDDSAANGWENRNSLILFWSADDRRSELYLRGLNNLGVHRVLQCLVIVTDDEEDSRQMARILSKEMAGFHFVYGESDQGPLEKIQGLPIPEIPYIVLLDESFRITSLNPDIRGLGKTIQELLN